MAEVTQRAIFDLAVTEIAGGGALAIYGLPGGAEFWIVVSVLAIIAAPILLVVLIIGVALRSRTSAAPAVQSSPSPTRQTTSLPLAAREHAGVAREPDSGVVLARVRSSGLAVRFTQNRLWLDSVGEVTPSQVASRDQRGALVWADDAARRWFITNYADSPPQARGSGKFASARVAGASGSGLLSSTERIGDSFSAAGLFQIGKDWALRYDETGNPEDRAEALAAMSEAHSKDPGSASVGYFDDGFGTLMADPEFRSFVSV